MMESSPYVLTIGDIGVTSDNQIVTPNGAGPLKGSQWIVHDQTIRSTGIPAYAIVLAIVFALACFLGLLFLLIKEDRVQGFITVNVRTGKLSHTTHVPAASPYSIAQVSALVAHAQTLAAVAA